MAKSKKIQKILEENNNLQKKLTKENQTYYEKLLTYVRTKNIFADEAELEELLLQILSDVLEAQNHGKTAENYLGKNPQKLGDELLASVKKASGKQLLQFFMVGIGIYFLFSVLGDLSSGAPLILGYDVLDFLFLLPTIYLMFVFIAKSVYGKNKLLPILPFVGFIVIHSFIPKVVPPFWLVASGNLVRFVLLVVSLLLLLLFILKQKMYSLIAPLGYFFVFSFLQFQPTFPKWQKTTSGLIVSILALAVVAFLMYWLEKRENKKD